MEAACAFRFTGAEGGARLAAHARARNTLAALAPDHAAFVACKLLHEQAYCIRGSISGGSQRSVYVTRMSRVACAAYELHILTDLSVASAVEYDDVDDWCAELDKKEVLVATSSVLSRLLKEGILVMANINVLILDSCHAICNDQDLQCIMKVYKESEPDKKPRILALTYPLFLQLKKENNPNEEETNYSSMKTDSDAETPTTGLLAIEEKSEDIEDNQEDVLIDQESESLNSKAKIIELTEIIDNETLKVEPVNNEIPEKCDLDNVDDQKVDADSDIVANIPENDGENSIDKTDVNTEIAPPDNCDFNEIEKHEIEKSSEKLSKNIDKENDNEFLLYEKLEWKIEELERMLCCQADFAEDIDGIKRLSASVGKPRELIVEYGNKTEASVLPQSYLELEDFMRETVNNALDFLQEHRYDPTEIYGEDAFCEELRGIPDPTLDPKEILNQFLFILDQLGPYGADKAAFSLLARVEKLKIKIPYERHFLLLCLCTSVLVKIRCKADYVFQNCGTDWERIQKFCTPKVHRLVEILEKFKPPNDLLTSPSKYCESQSDVSKKDSHDGTVVSKIDSNDSDNVVDHENHILKSSEVIETKNEDIEVNNQVIVTVDEVVTENEAIETKNLVIDTYDEVNKTCLPNEMDNVTDSSQNNAPQTKSNVKNIKSMMSELDACDFVKLSNTLADQVNTYEGNLCEIHDIPDKAFENCQNNDKIMHLGDVDNKEDKADTEEYKTVANTIDVVVDKKLEETVESIIEEKFNIKTEEKVEEVKKPFDFYQQKFFGPTHGMGMPGYARRAGQRMRGRGRMPRYNALRAQQMLLNPDALCGIVYIKDPLMAKILFMLIVELSRSHPSLGYLSALYSAVEPGADPQRDSRELDKQGRKQEEVLKKFRMHECNLLLATSALEEGIDLPRCNLVLRWDIPPSYRSYGLCRSRARAARSACVLLSDSKNGNTQSLVHSVATYKELDQMLSRKCGCGAQDEPPQSEEDHADSYTQLIKPYTPIISNSNKHSTIVNDKVTKSAPRTIISKTDAEVNDLDLSVSNDEKAEESHTDKTNEVTNINDLNNLSTEDLKTNEIGQVIDSVDKKLLSKINSQKSSVDTKSCKDSEEDGKIKCVDTGSTNVCETENDTVLKNAAIKPDGKTIESENEIASVDLSTAISLINRYCGKLPSDTFTRLAPQWWMEEIQLPVRKAEGDNLLRKAFICTLRLPLNCPVKYNIVGHPMPTRVLARRMVALQACRILHKSGELDNQLMPIGKENFKAPEFEYAPAPPGDNCHNMHANYQGQLTQAELSELARPGTTKRRQYYYKRTARSFTDCQPIQDSTDAQIEQSESKAETETKNKNKTTNEDTKPMQGKCNTLYAIVSRLWCALPERYNTRGRRLHAPQSARQGLAILTSRDIEKIPAFPVYTRSGEVRVSVERVPDADVRVSPRRGRLVKRFMRFVFAEVLRVRRRGMRLQADCALGHNNYYVVPTFKTLREDGTHKIDIDWAFLELIYEHTQNKSEVEKPLFWIQDEEETADEEQSSESVKKINPIESEILGTTSKDFQDVKMPNPSDEDKVVSEKTPETIDNKTKPEVKNDSPTKDTNNEVANEDPLEKMAVKVENPLLKPNETFIFDSEKYREAVVTPWYRNQDQPQFFLVAEICWNLSPESSFPSATHTTFRHYYTRKYGVTLTQSNQPLLDVDHTSARLNLLTPRYVNRKGVALPVSSERTRRAKRDRLDQKQILVPELCRVHPFAAPLWFATVALPCVLYRINALLIADEIRRAVAIDVGLGVANLDDRSRPGFEWPPLDFGWSLAEVLNVKESEKPKGKGEQAIEENKEVTEKALVENGEAVKEDAKIDEEEKDVKEKTLNDILQEKENESGFEIGMWSNDMAASVPIEFGEGLEPLPSNLTFCTSASGGTNWSDNMSKTNRTLNQQAFSVADSDCSYMSSDFDTDDSDMNSDESEDDTDTSGLFSSRNCNVAMGVRIEYKTAHEAEAVDVRPEKKTCLAPQPDPVDDSLDKLAADDYLRSGDPPLEYLGKFHQTVTEHERNIVSKGLLVRKHEPIITVLSTSDKEVADKNLKAKLKTDNEIEEIAKRLTNLNLESNDEKLIREMYEEVFPYGNADYTLIENGQISIDNVERNKRRLLNIFKNNLTKEEITKLTFFSMADVDIDSPTYVNEKIINMGFDDKALYVDKLNRSWSEKPMAVEPCEAKVEVATGKRKKNFDFDYQPNLEGHPGPSPSVILQGLTMSNANDGINLERLETIGDSFLKFAITAYLYCAHPTVHEGKLSHMRSKQVSNLNLYRLGRSKRLGARMIASKFEPHDNWLPPCHKPPATLGPRSHPHSQYESSYWDQSDARLISSSCPVHHPRLGDQQFLAEDMCCCRTSTDGNMQESSGCFIPYNLITQHSIPDKSVADCVEALIGAYLIECGPRGALLFMSWLGIRVLPRHEVPLSPEHPYVRAQENARSERRDAKPRSNGKKTAHHLDSDASDLEEAGDPGPDSEEPEVLDDWSWAGRPVGTLRPYRNAAGDWVQPAFGELKAPPSPLLRYIENPEGELEQMLSGYDSLERTLGYRFRDRSLLLQALTHASHQQNRLTDCYQRLEFLGDAILDYLITRHLYEDDRRHSPGALTDLRSALVNNTIFATLAARHGFHKYFRHMSPGLNEVLTRYVKIQEENGHSISEEHYLIQEDEMEQAEDVEVPKALGDLFESVAGAIFLDSGMSLGAVWRSYVGLMGAELEAFSAAAPKSPVRELLEAEPDTAKFGKPERLADGRRVRVCVEVFGRGTFKGVGRNYRIAKGTAARCALRHLKRQHRP